MTRKGGRGSIPASSLTEADFAQNRREMLCPEMVRMDQWMREYGMGITIDTSVEDACYMAYTSKGVRNKGLITCKASNPYDAVKACVEKIQAKGVV